MRRRRVVRVPASSANLGPGYDVLAAALAIELELEVEETGSFSVECDVPGVPLDRDNLCVRAFERLHPADGVRFSIRSQIPAAAGLGSSAAAIVAGLCAADHMYELDAPLFELARELEGHPDNVAAALLGGFVVCAGVQPGQIAPPAGLEGVLVVPPFEVPTTAARDALPKEVPIADTVHNVGHAALLVLGLERGDLSLIARGLSDRLHQPRRRSTPPRWSSWSGRRSWVRSEQRSPGPARQCCSGASGSRPGRSSNGCAARPRGPRCGGSPSRRAGRMSESSEAAGGVVMRDGLVAVVHRPRYDDWSLPKGKLDPGESFEQAALREVEEETGLRARLVRGLPSVEYEVKVRPKLVRYWLMEVIEDPGFAPNSEVDELRWLAPADAVELLSYDRDKGVVRAAASP
jgi:homoserine kinase